MIMKIVSALNLTPDQVVLKYGEYLNQQNIENILSIYDENAELIPDQVASLKGRKSIIDFYENTFKSIQIEGPLQIISTEIWGDIAIVRCEEPAKVRDLATGNETQHYFREMFVLRFKDNGWKIYKYMFSQNNNQIRSE